jgi:hypothetical protein
LFQVVEKAGLIIGRLAAQLEDPMDNAVMRWIRRKREEKRNEVHLEDVMPLHPYEYPAKHLKERLDARRVEMEDIEAGSHPTGMPDGAALMT